MRRSMLAAAIFALAAVTATGAAAAPKLIYKIDKVVAKTIDKKLVVSASGAVRSGGWTQPMLHLNPVRIPESATEVIEFLATPPAPGTVVIEALLPVSMTSVFPLPRTGTVNVTVVGETNSVTAPIEIPLPAQPATRGP